MKGRFHRSKGCGCEESCGCDSGGGCASCGGGAHGGVYGGVSGGAHFGAGGTVIGAPGGAPVQMAPVGEPIKAPKDATPGKKLPDDGKKKTTTGTENGTTRAIPEVTPLPPITTQGVGTSNNGNPF
jgi:hypothetical protein